MFRPKFLLLLVLASVLAPAPRASAQATSESDAAVTSALTLKVEGFFRNLKAPNVNAEDAFADLLADGPFDDPSGKRSDQLKTFVESYKKLESTSGRFLVAKQVQVKRVGEDLVFLTFLYESERFPTVWRFAFYRPPLDSLERPDWFVVRLSFDTKLEQLLATP